MSIKTYSALFTKKYCKFLLGMQDWIFNNSVWASLFLTGACPLKCGPIQESSFVTSPRNSLCQIHIVGTIDETTKDDTSPSCCTALNLWILVVFWTNSSSAGESTYCQAIITIEINCLGINLPGYSFERVRWHIEPSWVRYAHGRLYLFYRYNICCLYHF